MRTLDTRNRLIRAPLANILCKLTDAFSCGMPIMTCVWRECIVVLKRMKGSCYILIGKAWIFR